MKNKGFTLVEILATIVIMAVLLTIAIPGVMGISKSIKDKMFCTKVNNIEEAAKLYGKDFIDEVDTGALNEVTVKQLIEYNLYKKEEDGCSLNKDDNKPCVLDPRDNSSMDEGKVVLHSSNKKVYAYYTLSTEDMLLCEAKKEKDKYGSYTIRLLNWYATNYEELQNQREVEAIYLHDLPELSVMPKQEHKITLHNIDNVPTKTEEIKVNFPFAGYYLYTYDYLEGNSMQIYGSNLKGVKPYQFTRDIMAIVKWEPQTVTLPTIQKEGYYFNGWCRGEIGNEKCTTDEASFTETLPYMQEDIDLYAKWEEIEVPVVLYDENGQEPRDNVLTATYGQTLRDLKSYELPEKEYTFTIDYNDGATLNETVTINATFDGYYESVNGIEPKYYDSNGKYKLGNLYLTNEKNIYANWKNSSYELPSHEREGYTHIGWCTTRVCNLDPIPAGQTLNVAPGSTIYAQWKPIETNITLKQDGATTQGTTKVTAQYNKDMPAITIPSQKHTVTLNYRVTNKSNDVYQSISSFDGYFESKNGIGNKYYTSSGTSNKKWNKTTSTATLYAKWSGGSVTLPSHSINGYKFLGWYTDPTSGIYVGTGGESYTPSSDTTLYARWSANTYTLTYDNQSGSGCTSKSGTYDSTWGSLCTPTRSNYKFQGWYTGTNGSGTQISDSSKVSGNITVYAKWSANTYTLTYDNQSGTGCTSKSGTYDSTWGSLCTPTRSEYIFYGWYTGINGSGTQISDSSKVTGNITVYAKWRLAIATAKGIYYPSLQDAFNGAQSNEITLLQNTSEVATNNGTNYVNLNGKTISNTLINKGYLELKGSGNINTSGKHAIDNTGGNAILKIRDNVHINATAAAAVSNHGKELYVWDAVQIYGEHSGIDCNGYTDVSSTSSDLFVKGDDNGIYVDSSWSNCSIRWSTFGSLYGKMNGIGTWNSNTIIDVYGRINNLGAYVSGGNWGIYGPKGFKKNIDVDYNTSYGIAFNSPAGRCYDEGNGGCS